MEEFPTVWQVLKLKIVRKFRATQDIYETNIRHTRQMNLASLPFRPGCAFGPRVALLVITQTGKTCRFGRFWEEKFESGRDR